MTALRQNRTHAPQPHAATQHSCLKYVAPRPFADPAVAARKLREVAADEAVQHGRVHIEKIKAPFLKEGCTPAEYGAGIAVGACKRI